MGSPIWIPKYTLIPVITPKKDPALFGRRKKHAPHQRLSERKEPTTILFLLSQELRGSGFGFWGPPSTSTSTNTVTMTMSVDLIVNLYCDYYELDMGLLRLV